MTGTRRLVDAALHAGSPQLMYVSIVGVDRIPWRYYGAKLDAERLVASSGLPWTIQRATQFHPFLSAMLDRLARPPVLVAPRSFRFQPVDPADVADRLVQHVASGAVGRAPDFGGPEVLSRRPAWRAPGCGRAADAVRSCACRCRAASAGRSGPGRTCARSTPTGGVPGRSSWTRVSEHLTDRRSARPDLRHSWSAPGLTSRSRSVDVRTASSTERDATPQDPTWQRSASRGTAARHRPRAARGSAGCRRGARRWPAR